VKRLAADSMLGIEQVQAEVQLLGTCQHESLLPLLGFCLDGETCCCLVYPLIIVP